MATFPGKSCSREHGSTPSREAQWDTVKKELSRTRELMQEERLPTHHLMDTNILLAPALWRVNEFEWPTHYTRKWPHSMRRSTVLKSRSACSPAESRFVEGWLNAAANHGTKALSTQSMILFLWTCIQTIHIQRHYSLEDAKQIMNNTPRFSAKNIPGWVARLLTDQAFIACEQQRFSVAARCLEEAKPLSSREGDIYNLIRIQLVHAQCHRKQQAWPQALEHLEQAENLWATSQCVALRGLIALEKGRVFIGQSQREAAKSELSQAAEDLHRAGDRWDWVAALCWQAKAEDEPELIQRYTHQAQQVIESIGESSAVEVMEWVGELESVLDGPLTAHVLVLVDDKSLNQSICTQLRNTGHRVSSSTPAQNWRGINRSH